MTNVCRWHYLWGHYFHDFIPSSRYGNVHGFGCRETYPQSYLILRSWNASEYKTFVMYLRAFASDAICSRRGNLLNLTCDFFLYKFFKFWHFYRRRSRKVIVSPVGESPRRISQSLRDSLKFWGYEMLMCRQLMLILGKWPYNSYL